jgi:hypothetical protein
VAVVAGAFFWLHPPAPVQLGAKPELEVPFQAHPAAAPAVVPAAPPVVPAVPASTPPAAAQPAPGAQSGPQGVPPPAAATDRASRKKVRPAAEASATPANSAGDEAEPSSETSSRKGEPSAATPANVPASLPMDELRPLAGDLVREAGALRSSYDKYLDDKKDSGTSLSGDDDKLREELKVFEDAADAFNQPFRTGLLAGVKKRFQHLNDPELIVRRARALLDSASRVEALLPKVRPSAVQQAWREQRHERQRIASLCQL